MDDSTRATVLAAAEELFDRASLFRLASSIGEARKRKRLRFWQEEMLAQLSEHVGIDVNSKPQFIEAFNGTAEGYATPASQAEQEQLEEAKRKVGQEVKQIAKQLRRIARGSPYVTAPGTPQAPMNRNAEQIKFRVTFSLDLLVGSILRELQECQEKRNLHACCELVRAHHLGATVPGTKLLEAIHDSVAAATEYFDIGKTSIDGWYRQLSNGIFLCAFCGLDDSLVRMCAWATTRKKLDYQGTLDDEVQYLHLVLASLFQSEPSGGFRRLLTTCLKSPKTRIRLLANMVNAIIQNDQSGFETATRRAVQNYRKRKPPDANLALLAEWLPVHINTAYHVGLQRGMVPPMLPANVSAYLCGPFDGVQAVR